MASLSSYDLSIPYNGDETRFSAFEEAILEKFSKLMIYNQFMEPEKFFNRPKVAYWAQRSGLSTSYHLKAISEFELKSQQYQFEMQYCLVTIVVALGPMPRKKIVDIYKDESTSAYHKCHLMMDVLKSTYGGNTPRVLGPSKQEMAELSAPLTFKGGYGIKISSSLD